MKFNILAQPGFKITTHETARIIRDVGFDGVFLSLNQGEVSAEDAMIFRKCSLNIETLHLPYNVPFRIIDELWQNGENKHVAINILKRDIDFAYEQGINTVILHASSGKTPPTITIEGLKNFELIADYCRQKDVILAIENIRRFDYVEALLNNLPSDVKFCFDIGHANAFTHDLYSENWDQFFTQVHCIHIHDNNGIADQHLMPGMGNINYDLVMPRLLKHNRTLNATLELYYQERENFYTDVHHPEEFFQKAYDALKSLFAKYQE